MSELLSNVTERESTPTGPIGESAEHPIQLLMREHELLLELAGHLERVAAELSRAGAGPEAGDTTDRLRAIARQFQASENHYLREENVLFPYLEKHGVVEPPMVMWREHDNVRLLKKELYQIAGGEDIPARTKRLGELAREIAALLQSHFYKENHILFPAALQLFTQQEWEATVRQFGEIGFWKVFPAMPGAPAAEVEGRNGQRAAPDGEIPFTIGTIPLEALEPMLNTLPIDLTFVDAQDTVRYFSQTRDRIFPRTEAIIGRQVQQCHPEKSVHVVNQILEDFRNGLRDSAEFWIQSGGRFILIRYYALRREGSYLGCVEVTQDATGIRALEGERRLLS